MSKRKRTLVDFVATLKAIVKESDVTLVNRLFGFISIFLSCKQCASYVIVLYS
jgi:hypothetical protein